MDFQQINQILPTWGRKRGMHFCTVLFKNCTVYHTNLNNIVLCATAYLNGNKTRGHIRKVTVGRLFLICFRNIIRTLFWGLGKESWQAKQQNQVFSPHLNWYMPTSILCSFPVGVELYSTQHLKSQDRLKASNHAHAYKYSLASHQWE